MESPPLTFYLRFLLHSFPKTAWSCRLHRRCWTIRKRHTRYCRRSLWDLPGVRTRPEQSDGASFRCRAKTLPLDSQSPGCIWQSPKRNQHCRPGAAEKPIGECHNYYVFEWLVFAITLLLCTWKVGVRVFLPSNLRVLFPWAVNLECRTAVWLRGVNATACPTSCENVGTTCGSLWL